MIRFSLLAVGEQAVDIRKRCKTHVVQAVAFAAGKNVFKPHREHVYEVHVHVFVASGEGTHIAAVILNLRAGHPCLPHSCETSSVSNAGTGIS